MIHSRRASDAFPEHRMVCDEVPSVTFASTAPVERCHNFNFGLASTVVPSFVHFPSEIDATADIKLILVRSSSMFSIADIDARAFETIESLDDTMPPISNRRTIGRPVPDGVTVSLISFYSHGTYASLSI